MMKHLAPLLAEERLLMAEEKWIVEALQRIKKQRNCLQIEKLHLQSTKEAFKIKKIEENSLKSERGHAKQEPVASGKSIMVEIDLMQPIDTLIDLDNCNQKKMDLSISDNLSRILSNTFAEEYDEEESDEDNDFFLLRKNQQSPDFK